MKFSQKIKSISSVLLSSSIILTTSITQSFTVPLSQVKAGFAKNVIIMIPDGMSRSGVTLSRWVYKDGEPLNIDEIATGLVRTHNSDTIIADSAPSGTAMATGYKTQDKLIGVKPTRAILPGARNVTDEDALAPTASILEAAKLNGKAVGIVATAEIQHATPADFTAHVTHRNMYTSLGEQQVYQNMDVVMGGGRDYLLPDPNKSTDPRNKMRIDNENMEEVLKDMGYNFVTTKDEMKSVTSGKLWGAFTPQAMSKHLVKSNDEPSIAEMTKKSIELLSKNKNGFFLMVEGSQIDWAAHRNQTIGVISEIKAFDDAVGEALKFAKSNKDTLVIVAPDHGNGGISIGDLSTSRTYPEHSLEYFTSTLKKATITEEHAATLINQERSNLKEVMSKVGVSDLTSEEESKVVSAKGIDKEGKQFDSTVDEISKIVSKRSKIGWTTGGHTGEDVALYVYSSDFKNTLTGTIQNSDIALYSAKALGLDLDKTSEKLFIPQSKLKSRGYESSIDSTDSTNLVLVIKKDSKEFRLPENKNYLEVDGKKISFNGVSVFNGKQFYIPQAALNLVK